MTASAECARNAPVAGVAAGCFNKCDLGRLQVKELNAALSLLRMLRALHLRPEELQKDQARRLRETVQHAYGTTPYYRNLLNSSGIRPHDIRSVSDLAKIPISRKEDLVSAPFEDRTAGDTNLRNCVRMSTSGTTAAPWDFLVSSSERLQRALADLRARLVNGYSFFDRACSFLDPRWLPEPRHWYQHLGLLRLRYFSILDDVDTKVATLTEGNYDFIYSITSNLFAVAEAILERGVELRPPKLVITWGEVLHPLHRKTIHRAFGPNPTDFYSSVEFGPIAWQCPERKGYHVNADLFVLELVKDGRPVGPGEDGEVVITDLGRRAAPMIRFATGDWSCSSDTSCTCRITFPTLSHIGGRTRDFLLLPSGKKIAPYYVTVPLENTSGIRSFQVVQVSECDVIVRFTRYPGASDDVSEAIRRALRPVIGETMKLRTEEVASIERRGGKFRIVENAVLDRHQLR